MNEIERKRLEKVKPDIPISLVDEVSLRLTQFQSSSQFEMLSGVHLAQFFSDPEMVPDSLKQKTLENLVDEGAYLLSLEPEISKEHISEILIILSKFLPEAEEEPEHSQQQSESTKQIKEKKGDINKKNETPSHRKKTQYRPEVPILSSVDAERSLTERYSRLKNDPQFESLKYKKIAEYWDPEVIRAPFLEQLTFREILEISVDHLLKKRSVGNTKVFCLIQAFDRLFEASEDLIIDEKATSRLASVGELPKPVRKIPTPKWKSTPGRTLPEGASLLLMALIESWEYSRQELLLSSQQPSTLLRAALVSLPDSLSQVDLLLLWHSSEAKIEVVCDLLGKSLDEVTPQLEEAKKVAALCFEENAGEEIQWLQNMLRGIGVSEDELVFPIKGSEVPEHIRVSALRICLTALGASAPVVNGEILSGYWTSKPEGLEQILTKVSQAGTREEQEELVSTLAPQFPTEVLLKALNKK